VAQSLHWLNAKAFFREADRVLKPNGILAVWSYNLLKVNPDIDDVIRHLYYSILDRYWPKERKMVEEDYQNITFPFCKMKPPLFEMNETWTLNQLIGYLQTWSAVKEYTKKHRVDPIQKIYDQLARLWGDSKNA
jgi:SAM-dependent methyltransferase